MVFCRAVAEYERSLNPVESAVAAQFRRKIAPIMDRYLIMSVMNPYSICHLTYHECINRPLVLLREFQQYRYLLQRPTVRAALVDERESLLSLLRYV